MAKEKKQFTELSDEELKNVTGGFNLQIAPQEEIGLVKAGCSIQSCDPGYKLDRSLEPCQCVPVPNP